MEEPVVGLREEVAELTTQIAELRTVAIAESTLVAKLVAELREQKAKNQEHAAALEKQTTALRQLLEMFTTVSAGMVRRREVVH